MDDITRDNTYLNMLLSDPAPGSGTHERMDMAFTASIISCSIVSPGLLGMCENMSNCRRSTYHHQLLGSWLVF